MKVFKIILFIQQYKYIISTKIIKLDVLPFLHLVSITICMALIVICEGLQLSIDETVEHDVHQSMPGDPPEIL